MALVFTNLASTGTATDASSYALPSVNIEANALILLGVNNSRAASPADISSITGLTGATWELIKSQPFNSTGSPVSKLQLWRTMVGTSQNGATISIAFATTQTGHATILDMVTGVATSGSNGSGAVAQSTFKSTSATATLTVTLPGALGSTNNVAYGLFGRPTNTAILNTASFVQLADVGAGTPAKRAHSQNAATTEITMTASMSANDHLTGIAIEVVVQSASTAGGAQRFHFRTLRGVGV